MLLELLSAITTKMLYLILHIENAGSFPKPLSAKEEKKRLLNKWLPVTQKPKIA